MPSRDEFLPSASAFSSEITVAPEHIDELGHVNNVVWVRWVNEAAIRHSVAVGLGPDVYLSLKVVWVVRRHDVEYLVPALVGERLKTTTWVATLRGATSLRRTVFEHADSGRRLVQAETTWALIDMESAKPRRVPKEMMARYGFLA